MTGTRLRQALEREKRSLARSRILAVRMTEEDMARLASVAKAEGLAPATLARVLIMAGIEDLEGERPRKEG